MDPNLNWRDFSEANRRDAIAFIRRTHQEFVVRKRPQGRGCCAEFPSKAELQGREHPVPGTTPLRAPSALVS